MGGLRTSDAAHSKNPFAPLQIRAASEFLKEFQAQRTAAVGARMILAPKRKWPRGKMKNLRISDAAHSKNPFAPLQIGAASEIIRERVKIFKIAETP